MPNNPDIPRPEPSPMARVTSAVSRQAGGRNRELTILLLGFAAGVLASLLGGLA